MLESLEETKLQESATHLPYVMHNYSKHLNSMVQHRPGTKMRFTYNQTLVINPFALARVSADLFSNRLASHNLWAEPVHP